MLQSLIYEDFVKVDNLFIIQSEKITTKFGNLVGKRNMKELLRIGNFKTTTFGKVFSRKF